MLLSLCGGWIWLQRMWFHRLPLTGKKLHRDSGFLQQFCALELSWNIAVLEGRSPTVGNPLAKNLWAWEDNRHSSHNCSPCVLTCGGTALESLWVWFLVFFLGFFPFLKYFFVYGMLCFSQCSLVTDKLPGLLDYLLESTFIFLNLPCYDLEIWQ